MFGRILSFYVFSHGRQLLRKRTDFEVHIIKKRGRKAKNSKNSED